MQFLESSSLAHVALGAPVVGMVAKLWRAAEPVLKEMEQL